jgi:hypothetical protein
MYKIKAQLGTLIVAYIANSNYSKCDSVLALLKNEFEPNLVFKRKELLTGGVQPSELHHLGDEMICWN